MTLKQLERKAKQLIYRRRLAQAIDSLQEGIKTYMQVEHKEQVRTKTFDIHLFGEELCINLPPKVDPRQMKLKFPEKL